MDFERRKRPFRHLGRIIDIINILLSLAVIICIVFIALDREANLILFPVIFFCASVINIALLVKYLKRREGFRVMTLGMGALLFLGLGIFTLLVVL
ncbi:MAG: hypothetical protein IJD58_13500 [Lachnospiraceae bacterium]|nr:hypothetical protein [Lachnospiraceae bacterium]